MIIKINETAQSKLLDGSVIREASVYRKFSRNGYICSNGSHDLILTLENVLRQEVCAPDSIPGGQFQRRESSPTKMEEEIKKQIERINKLNYGLCRQISELEHDVESLQSHRQELKYGHGCSRHIRGQQKISATLQLLSSTDSATACCLINHQKGVNGQGQDAGQNKKPPKPDWMSPALYNNSTTMMSSSKFKNCLGCGQVFRSLRAGDHFSFEYQVHVVEECVKYKELNLITECKECNFKFVTKRSYHHHETLVHSRKPDWMSARLFSLRNAKGPKESVPCPGCGQELERRKGRGYRMSDYIHMIEECEGYKKLDRIKTCRNCSCKFINSKSFKKHKC